MKFESLSQVLIHYKNYLMDELISRFKNRPWTPYHEFVFKSDYILKRADIYITFMIQALEGDEEPFLFDQKQQSKFWALQGFRPSSIWQGQILGHDIIFELLEKLDSEGKLQFSNMFAEINKLEALYFRVYEILTTTYMDMQERIINKNRNHIRILTGFTRKLVNCDDVKVTCNDFLSQLSSVFDIKDFILVLYKSGRIMDTFSIPDSSILNRLQPAIDDAFKSNSMLYKDSSGVVSKFDLQVGPVNVLLIPNILHRRLKGVLALHNHEKGFELTAEDLELINQMLHYLLFGLENLVSHHESMKLRQEQKAGAEKLTPRELEILKCMAAGHTNQEIAKMLYISFHTVRSHVSHLFKKLGVSSRSQAIIKGIREGFVDSSG